MAQRNRTSPVIWPAGMHYQRTDRTSRRSLSAGENPVPVEQSDLTVYNFTGPTLWCRAGDPPISRSGGTSETRSDVVTVRWQARGQSVSHASALPPAALSTSLSSQTLTLRQSCNDLTPAVNHAAHPQSFSSSCAAAGRQF